MPQQKVNIAETRQQLRGPFEHAVLGQVDGHCATLVHFHGGYPFHAHEQDEMYVVLEGEAHIDYQTGESVRLVQGDTLVVKRHVVHRSSSADGALVLMFKARKLLADWTPL